MSTLMRSGVMLNGANEPWAFNSPHRNHFLLTLQPPILRVGSFPQQHPLSYGEGIELDPLPPKEIR